MRRARVSGSGGGESLSSNAAWPGNESRRSCLGDWVVPGGSNTSLVARANPDPVSAVAWREGFGGISGGFEPEAEGGGGGNCDEALRRGTARAVVLAVGVGRAGSAVATIGEREVVELEVESNQEGGGNSTAFWLLFSFSCCCWPFLPNFTNCSRACIFARGRALVPLLSSMRVEETPTSGVLWRLTPDRSLVERLRRVDDEFALDMMRGKTRMRNAIDSISIVTRLTRESHDDYHFSHPTVLPTTTNGAMRCKTAERHEINCVSCLSLFGPRPRKRFLGLFPL